MVKAQGPKVLGPEWAEVGQFCLGVGTEVWGVVGQTRWALEAEAMLSGLGLSHGAFSTFLPTTPRYLPGKV